jgi:ribosomal protein L6P/L9E
VWLKFHGVNYRSNLWVNGHKVALLPGEKHTVEVQLDASLVTEGKLLFKLDGWNLQTTQEQELLLP